MEIDIYTMYFYATRTEIVFVCLDYEDEGTIVAELSGTCLGRTASILEFSRNAPEYVIGGSEIT